MHASASPFEALAERMNWLSTPVEADPYGSYLLERGLSKAQLDAWSVDPTVPMPDSGKGSIFDVRRPGAWNPRRAGSRSVCYSRVRAP